ncbi:hypothetical protein BGY98DRAFT_1011301 [Russula aff. rugulosa BPL654]|nr:hypothetical protein BGY98DRAFT_1011301 [Russula aff. rugulosa BPL654]
MNSKEKITPLNSSSPLSNVFPLIISCNEEFSSLSRPQPVTGRPSGHPTRRELASVSLPREITTIGKIFNTSRLASLMEC